MEIRKLKNKEYEFVNESGSTRNGFYHKSTLFHNGYKIAERKVNYLNRTWENYTFQTSMLCCLEDYKQQELYWETNQYKKENNITRLTQKRKQEILDKFNNSELGKTLLDIRTELRGQVW